MVRITFGRGEQYTISEDVEDHSGKLSPLICIILHIKLSLIQYLLNIKPNLTILGMANDTCNNTTFVTCTPASDATPTGPIAATAKKFLQSESRSSYMATFTGAICKQWIQAFAEGNKVF